MTSLLIVGATGLVGSEVLRLALADTRVSQVVALTRKPLPSHPKLQNPVVDFKNLPDDASWWHVDAAICALGTTAKKTPDPEEYRVIEVEYPLAIARGVKAHGGKSFGFISAKGASPKSVVNYLRLKAEAEKELTKLQFESLTIVRPGLLQGKRHEKRVAESLGNLLLGLLKPLLPPRMRPVPAHKVARSLLLSALNASQEIRIIESEEL